MDQISYVINAYFKGLSPFARFELIREITWVVIPISFAEFYETAFDDEPARKESGWRNRRVRPNLASLSMEFIWSA